MLGSLQKEIIQKYNTLYSRVLKAKQEGRFSTYTAIQKRTLYERLCRYEKRLKHWGIAVASATALFSAPIITQAQVTFEEQIGLNNPFNKSLFNGLEVSNNSAPAFADVDGDGDLDIFIGAKNGTIKYYQNILIGGSPTFIEQTGTNNPLDGIDVGDNSVTSFVDIDGDNDLDVFIGERSGTIKYYENTGGSPAFMERTGTSNPLSSVNLSTYSNYLIDFIGFASIDFLDIDGDGDFDAFTGEYAGTIKYYENTGSSSSPIFVEQTGTNNPLNVGVGNDSTPNFVDIGNDGDWDVFIGVRSGTINYYENTGIINSPIFEERTGTNNPLGGIDVGDNSVPNFADIDGDGDLDAFIGEYAGTIKYFENTVSNISPTFVDRSGIDFGNESAPTFIDIDGDGDLDVFIGVRSGTINYYENTGTINNPIFEERTGTNNPLHGIDVGDNSVPSFVDVDGDDDFDALIGEQNGSIRYYKNMGSSNSPTFTDQNPVDIGDQSTPSFVDIDGDGDLDFFSGERNDPIKYFRNTGTSSNPVFEEQTGTNNPLNGINTNFLTTPTFIDIDGDSDFDAFIGDFNGTITYFKNTGLITSPTFVQQAGTNNPLDGVDVGDYSAPTFIDIDGDSDFDAFIGALDGTISYFLNTGNSTSPVFVEQMGTDNPLDGDFGRNITPAFADIDGDGDFDAFSGEFYGTIKYFKNTGSSTSPVFVEQMGTNNLFDGLSVIQSSTPTLVDIDGDGDFDAFSGEWYGTIKYFQNTGSSSSPAFTAKIGPNNPFGGLVEGINVGNNSKPTFVKIDGDVDIDAFIGVANGTIKYLQNTGSSSSPVFEEQTGTNNPLSSINVGGNSAPAFVDIDGDGDFDTFSGEQNGTIKHFKNIGSSSIPDFEEQTGTNNPLSSVEVGDNSTPTFVDIDGDGDFDAFIGAKNGTIKYFKNTSTLVPVELTTFTGKSTKAGNLLTWNTASELNNAGFDVEQSKDGVHFEKIGFVPGNGTTVEEQTYEFLDKTVVSDLTYYRLKQTDFDGAFEYSKIIVVSNKDISDKQVLLYPNPVGEVLTLENAQGYAMIYNALGQAVKQFEVQNALFSIGLNELPQGVYSIQIRKADGTITTQQFVK